MLATPEQSLSRLCGALSAIFSNWQEIGIHLVLSSILLLFIDRHATQISLHFALAIFF
jgi:hypothetical protein